MFSKVSLYHGPKEVTGIGWSSSTVLSWLPRFGVWDCLYSAFGHRWNKSFWQWTLCSLSDVCIWLLVSKDHRTWLLRHLSSVILLHFSIPIQEEMVKEELVVLVARFKELLRWWPSYLLLSWRDKAQEKGLLEASGQVSLTLDSPPVGYLLMSYTARQSGYYTWTQLRRRMLGSYIQWVCLATISSLTGLLSSTKPLFSQINPKFVSYHLHAGLFFPVL